MISLPQTRFLTLAGRRFRVELVDAGPEDGLYLVVVLVQPDLDAPVDLGRADGYVPTASTEKQLKRAIAALAKEAVRNHEHGQQL